MLCYIFKLNYVFVVCMKPLNGPEVQILKEFMLLLKT